MARVPRKCVSVSGIAHAEVLPNLASTLAGLPPNPTLHG